MKNLVTACTIMCIVIFACHYKSQAQTAQTRWGIKAGLSFTTLGVYAYSQGNTSSTRSYEYKPGLQAGVFGSLTINDKFDFIPQLLYTQKGGRAADEYFSGDEGFAATYTTQLNYIDLPLLMGFKVAHGITFTLGPQASFLLSEKTTISYDRTSTSSGNTHGYRGALVGGNAGVTLAAGANFSMTLNYTRDFQHIYSSSVADGGYDLHSPERNSGFAFTISHFFN